MKLTGVLLILVGVIVALYALNMNVTVEGANLFQRINNTGLMADRSNILGIAETLFLAGVVFFGFGAMADAKAIEPSPTKVDTKPSAET